MKEGKTTLEEKVRDETLEACEEEREDNKALDRHLLHDGRGPSFVSKAAARPMANTPITFLQESEVYNFLAFQHDPKLIHPYLCTANQAEQLIKEVKYRRTVVDAFS